MFLSQTIENILANIKGNTEIIAVCDGNWPDPPVKDHPRVTLIYHAKSIGQRAATNEAARYSKAKYIMKADAHCAFDQGFDVKLMENIEHDWTVVPRQYNLHAFNWLCQKCQNETYQGPTPTKCDKCDNTKDFTRKMIWEPRPHTCSDYFRFDSEMKFQYWKDYKTRPEAKGDIVDIMSCLGACWMMHRERYWDLDGLDEGHGSWGQMGTEIACKSWLSGGRLVVNKKTWYAHMFRTQGGDFGFPYPISGRQTSNARKYSNDMWKNGKWPKAKYSLSWLIEKFAPVPTWGVTTKAISGPDNLPVPSDIQDSQLSSVDKTCPIWTKDPVCGQKVSKGIVYYTDNRLDERILRVVQKRIAQCANGHEIVSVSLKPMDFGKNIHMDLDRGYLTMFKQILAGLEASTADIIYLAEHDVLYHPSHFDYIPKRKDVFYYDENRWFVDYATGRALFYNAASTSMLCAYRELLIPHYRKRVERVEKEGFSRRLGFEPGNHPFPRGVDYYGRESWMAPYPSIDIRHRNNLTSTRWSKDQFRNKGNLYAWKESDEIPGWGLVKGRFGEILDAI